MSTTFDPPLRHPVLACADAMEAALKETSRRRGRASCDPRTSEPRCCKLSRVEAQLSALRLRLMAASDDVALDEGARDVAALVTHLTHTDGGANRRDLVLAESLDGRWRQVATALAAGDVNLAQARVIVHALDELPRDLVTADVLERAEAHLVAEAAHFGPRELRVLGRRVLDVVAPEVSEQHEAEALAAEERLAWRRTSLSSARLGDGITRFTINVPDAVAARLRTYLEAFTSPRHHGSGDGRSGARRRTPRTGVLRAARGLRPSTPSGARRRRHHGGRHRAARDAAQRARERRARAVGPPQRRRSTAPRLHGGHPPGGPGREVRGARPGPVVAIVQAGPAQGHDHPRP